MLVFDNVLLGDYLDGREETRQFLEAYEQEPWAVSSIVVYEAMKGCVHGHVGGTPRTVQQAIMTSMDVLEITEMTAVEAAYLQDELSEYGVRLDHLDELVAANAREHGGTFATAREEFRREDLREILDVVPYDPEPLGR